MKFCFLCGKKTEDLIEGYCEECYNKKFQLISVPEKIEITICSRCNKIKERNKWKDAEVDEIIRNKIKILGKDVRIKIEKNDVAKIHAKGFLKGSKKAKEEVHEVKLKLHKVTCPTCSKKAGRYYESVVQVRGDLADDDFDSIDDLVLLKGGFYRLEEVKGGYDFFVSDKSLAKKIIVILRNKYRKAEIKKSFELYTKEEGKDIYRDTILIRIKSD